MVFLEFPAWGRLTTKCYGGTIGDKVIMSLLNDAVFRRRTYG